MTLTLRVDGERWRTHLRETLRDEPDLVPVVKGNGYGFTNARLARRTEWLREQPLPDGGTGADLLAVGTYAEIADVEQRYHGDLQVLTPWRPFLPGAVAALGNDRVRHTVGRLDDVAAILAHAQETGDRPRVLLERATSMQRHGLTARGLRAAADQLRGTRVRVEGASLHLPLESGRDNLEEADVLMVDLVSAGLLGDGRQVSVSHLSPDGLEELRSHYPEARLRPRVGTALWLGDRGALRVTATVLDAHPVERGDRVGYRRRPMPRSGTLLVVSGGTAHGIGLEAPTGEGGLRARAASVARGGLDAVGAVRSPYTVAGKQRYFAEPPHMQASLLFLPSGVDAPPVGGEVDVRVRFTATAFDRVEIG